MRLLGMKKDPRWGLGIIGLACSVVFRYTQRMGKIGGLALLGLGALTGCSAPVAQHMEAAAIVQPATNVQGDMLAALRPVLTALKADDAALISEAYGACMSLVFQSKDAYREGVMKQYTDVKLAVDHLTVAAAAKQHLCR